MKNKPNKLSILSEAMGSCVKSYNNYWYKENDSEISSERNSYKRFYCSLFENNVTANGNYDWISQQNKDFGQHGSDDKTKVPILYPVKNSLFDRNRKFVGTGGIPALNFKDRDPSVLNLVNTKLSDSPVQSELDQSKKNFMHPVEGY